MSALLASIMLIGILFAGHMHNLYVVGGRVYDDHDGRTSAVNGSQSAVGPLVVAANNRLWACWSEDGPCNRRVVYCSHYDEIRGWQGEFMGSVAGDVTGLYPISADRMVLNVHITDINTDACLDNNRWTWVPESEIWAYCGLGPRIRVYLPGVLR